MSKQFSHSVWWNDQQKNKKIYLIDLKNSSSSLISSHHKDDVFKTLNFSVS